MLGGSFSALGSTTPDSLNKNEKAMTAMIDKNAYERKVMIIQNCLALARVYHDQEDVKQSEYYTRLASEYFGEVLGLVGCKE